MPHPQITTTVFPLNNEVKIYYITGGSQIEVLIGSKKTIEKFNDMFDLKTFGTFHPDIIPKLKKYLSLL